MINGWKWHALFFFVILGASVIAGDRLSNEDANVLRQEHTIVREYVRTQLKQSAEIDLHVRTIEDRLSERDAEERVRLLKQLKDISEKSKQKK